MNKLDNKFYFDNLKRKKYRLLAEISVLEETKRNYSPSILSSNLGGVHGSGNASPTENAALNNITFFEELNKEIKGKEAELLIVNKDIEAFENYINSIADEWLRDIFIDRYKHVMSWTAIATSRHYAPSSWKNIQRQVKKYYNQHILP